MTYDDAIGFWYGRINYEVRSARPSDLKLERMRALLRRLGDPHERLRLVHVTGTKGKGSTCAMLAAVLQTAGYRVGLFTSPHLTSVEERMQVDRAPISHGELTALMGAVAPAVRALEADATYPPPTFFEIGTALGFLHFVRRRCDIAVLEVGLGGRFDSTNVCHPLVSVITNIGFDHMAQLGRTLEEIAYQKAGIIKRHVPVVSGVVQPGPREVVRRVAAEMGAPLWEVMSPQSLPAEPILVASSEAAPLVPPSRMPSEPTPPGPGGVGTCGAAPGRYAEQGMAPCVGSSGLGLLGAHQRANAALACCAIERLREAGMTIPAAAVARGLAEVKWPARIELVSTGPAVVLDTAHNVPSAEALVDTLRECVPVPGRKRVVFAVSSDKQYAEILRVLAGYFDHFHLTKYGNNPRCVPPEKLAAVLRTVAPDKPFSTHATSSDALTAARAATGAGDLVCVTGSVFLAGELRPVLL
jgi:dihydrofolate synthase/folylpolyglutamate synthase